MLFVEASLGEGDSIRGLASLSPRVAGPAEIRLCYSHRELPGPEVVRGWGQGMTWHAEQPWTPQGQESGDLALT